MGNGSMATGWHVLKRVQGVEQQTGPFTWEQLYGMARSGGVAADDLVWNPALTGWLQAAQVPGLLSPPMAPAVAPTQTAYVPPVLPATAPARNGQAPAFPAGQAHAPPQAVPKRRGWLIPVIVVATVIVLGGIGGGAWAFLSRDGGGGATASSTTVDGSGAETGGEALVGFGKTEIVDADPALIVETQEYGRAAADQVLVLMVEGKGREEAEDVGVQIGGTVVGEMEYISLYQIQIPSTTAEDLESAVRAAAAMPGVEAAFPNGLIVSQAPVEGKKCSPLRDPLYEGDNSRAYDMIGLQQAWDIIRASGTELNPVHVGVVDTAVYTESGQSFGTELNFPDANGRYPEGKAHVSGLSAADVTDQPDPNEPGGLSHGAQVAHVMAADADNGGVVGVLGPAGGKVTMTTSNALNAGRPYWQAQSIDPSDVTQYQGFYYKALVELQKQVDKGATVINLSFGPNKVDGTNAGAMAAYKRFFEKMQEDHPKVLFVAAAGNQGGGLNGTNYFPGGAKLPNVITVGALDRSGDRADARDWYSEEQIQGAYDREMANGSIPTTMTLKDYADRLPRGSNYATGDGEVTLAACGTGVPTGVDAEGRPVISNGTSFAAPQVAAAAALLKSINPKLEADDIKLILADSADSEVEQPDGTKVAVPANVGGKVLRVDKAVLAAINQLRPSNDQLKMDDLVGLSTVDLIAEPGPDGFTVTASVARVGRSGTDITISLSGEGSINGSTTQRLSGPGSVSWNVEPKGDFATIKVHRSDTKACAILNLDRIDLNGSWEGTLTFTKVELSPEMEQALEEMAANPPSTGDLGEGCDLSQILQVLKDLEGKSVPMTMDITADPGGGGMVTMFLDFSVMGGESEPSTVPLTWNGNTITLSGEGSTMTGTATREGDAIVMKGTMSGTSGEGKETITMAAVWTVTKR